MEQGEDGGAGAGQEGAGDFRLREQPGFQVGEEEVLFEDGELEVVDQGAS